MNIYNLHKARKQQWREVPTPPQSWVLLRPKLWVKTCFWATLMNTYIHKPGNSPFFIVTIWNMPRFLLKKPECLEHLNFKRVQEPWERKKCASACSKNGNPTCSCVVRKSRTPLVFNHFFPLYLQVLCTPALHPSPSFLFSSSNCPYGGVSWCLTCLPGSTLLSLGLHGRGIAGGIASSFYPASYNTYVYRLDCLDSWNQHSFELYLSLYRS